MRPVCPIWHSLETKPASTAARDAPIAAPSASASGSRIWNFSSLCIPRPPETITRAASKSGRLESVRCTASKRDKSNVMAFSSDIFLMGAVPLSIDAASKAIPRMVRTFFLSVERIVAKALPA